MPQVVDHAGARCASCHQPLTGRYCAQCGEKVLEPHALTVRHFVAHALMDELVHLDGKFWRTLRSLVLRPGFLTVEYSAGRRRPYIAPIRLLLASIITYALLTQGGLLVTLMIGPVALSVAPTAVPSETSVAETVHRLDRFGLLSNLLAANERSVDTASDAARERFHQSLNRFAQPVSFANVLFLAAALYLLFHRRRRLFVEHAVFSTHVVSFVLISSLALLPAVWLLEINHGASLAMMLGVTIWQFAYLAIAIRRFYLGAPSGAGRTRVVAIATAMLIYLLNSAFLTAVQLAGAAIALQRL